MAYPAVTFLVEKVKQLLEYHVGLISGSENELEQLMNDLSLFKAFLKDVCIRSKQDEKLREMERNIRDLVYLVEDTVDSYLTKAAAGKSSFFSKHIISLAKEVKSLRQNKVKPMLDTVTTYFVSMPIDDGSGTTAEEPSPKMKMDRSIRKENIFGFEDAEATLTRYLNEETDELDVISIVGKPGVGKTTLAWKIYESPRIKYEFATRIWVEISQKLERRHVLLKIMERFTNEDMSSKSDIELALIVCARLKEGKFLLVMDDVWTFEDWDNIRDVLPRSNRMGKVLITCRNKKVAKVANIRRKPYELRILSPKDSWELLQLQVFGTLHNCPTELEDIGREIVSHCAGVPLAIGMIGKILHDKFSETVISGRVRDAWMNVAENISMYVRNDEGDHMSSIISESYKNLPAELRDCFIYLGVFPNGYEIPVWTLTCLWIAEGFIQQREGQSLEETAEENLYELINRNLVMVDKTNLMGKVKTCRVRNMIREFCNSKAAMEEYNLFQEIKLTNEREFDPPVNQKQMYRRLCIHHHLSDFPSERLNNQCVRSFLCFYKDPIDVPREQISAILDVCHLLRILEFKSIKLTRFPAKLTKLIHLRYITLSGEYLCVLPKAISDLWNLQTLLIDTKSRTLIMKASLWKMIQLRHLKTKASIILSKKGEGKAGENLQTLSRLSPECCTDDLFNKAHNLKKLGIRGGLVSLLDVKSLDKLECLEKLKLLNDAFPMLVSGNPLIALPKPNWFPPNLKRLTLSATYLDWKHMSTLEMIDTLEVLKLKDNAFVGGAWETVSGGFPCLKFLLIATTDLVSWESSDDHFPALKNLVLKKCEKLNKIPVGLAKSLKVLVIEHVTRSVVESAREIEKKNKDMEVEGKGKPGGFKLSVGPGDD
ncbi:hypothetical protein BUALT_Bualt07G0017900 [Buddleja alternifolia]|uniref:Uncharacterized protein n=1 Tax=Buddleja alternifolia TaxID=168488 RepID=A0AAV6X8B5_9LAMI|nr:hypothetical protein BUALT_Bualt07G0017900 [Buddleja alternifolia]